MAKGTSKKSVSVEKVDAANKPKETMFRSGPIAIPAEFSFTREEFMERFRGQKTGKSIDKVYDEYVDWCKKNK